MKKIITIVAALSAIGLAVPAAAQDRYGNQDRYGSDNSYGYTNGNNGVEARIDQLQRRFQVGIQRGTISRQEAAYLRDGFRRLDRAERQYSRGGFDRSERRDLQQRIQDLQQRIQFAERSRDTRYGRDDWRDGRADNDDRYDGDRRGDDRRDRGDWDN